MGTAVFWTVVLLSSAKISDDLWTVRRPPFEWATELVIMFLAYLVAAVAAGPWIVGLL